MALISFFLVIGVLGIGLQDGMAQPFPWKEWEGKAMDNPFLHSLLEEGLRTHERRRQTDSRACLQVLFPCSSHGVCLDSGEFAETDAGYTCQCHPGHTGDYCETLDFCGYFTPCNNGGKCYPDDKMRFLCECAPGFNGPRCELRCDINLCLADFDAGLSELIITNTSSEFKEADRDQCGELADTLIECIRSVEMKEETVCACSDWDVEKAANALHDRETFIDNNCFANAFQCKDSTLQRCGDMSWTAYNIMKKLRGESGQAQSETQAQLDSLLDRVQSCASEVQESGMTATGCTFNQWIIDLPPQQVPNYIMMSSCPVRINDDECNRGELCRDGGVDSREYEKTRQCVLEKAAEYPEGCDKLIEFADINSNYLKGLAQTECAILRLIDSFKKDNGCPNLQFKGGIRKREATHMTLEELGANIKIAREARNTKAEHGYSIKTLVKLMREFTAEKEG